MTRQNFRAATTLLLGLALAGCNKNVDDAPPVSDDATLRRIADCDDLRQHVADTLVESMMGWYGYRGGEVPEADNGAEDGGGEPSDFTTTNNQEEGVDELDSVKTNGTHMFVAQNRALHVLRSWPAAETEQIARVDIPGWVAGSFLVGEDRLVVLTNLSAHEAGLGGDAWWSVIRVIVFDISDPAAPVQVRTEDIEGWLTSARLIDGKVHIVANQYMNLPWTLWENAYQNIDYDSQPAWDAPAEAWAAWRAIQRAAIRPGIEAAVAQMSLTDLLPDARTGAAPFEAMYACDSLYVPAQLGALNMLSVATIDPAAPGVEAVGVMADGWITYASVDNLYVAQTSGNWWGWSWESRSHIHRFSVGGDTPSYEGSGAVDGWLLNQFSMSEFDGHLRVATTDSQGWWGGVAEDAVGGEAVVEGGDSGADQEEPPAEEPPVQANNIFVLELGAGALTQVGELRGFGETEQIQAVRFMGEKGYVVTFRRTDPLFTLDLSDPSSPQLVGELHMPGYSAYLHPIDGDHLIGVGMAGTEEGQLTGLSVAVFDVTDLANPTLTHRYDIDPGEGNWSWSEALWDHHAFTYHRGVLTIPMMTSWYDESTGAYGGFSGVISLEAGIDGISELGRVDHQELVDASECLYDIWWRGEAGADGDEVAEGEDGDVVPPDDGGDPDPGEEEPVDVDPDWSYCDDGGYWYSSVRRSVYIEDFLYSVSDFGVRVTDLYAPDDVIRDVLFYPAQSE